MITGSGKNLKCDTIDERNSLIGSIFFSSYEGLNVFVSETSKDYIYSNGSWVDKTASGGSSYDGDPSVIEQDDSHQFVTTAERLKLFEIEEGATLNSPDSELVNRSNHTGSQSSSTISDFHQQVRRISALVSE